MSYVWLDKIRWPYEQIQVFANEIRRLAGLADYTREGLEQTVRLQFMIGFPNCISVVQKQLPNIKTASLSEIISSARVLATDKASSLVVVSVKTALM